MRDTLAWRASLALLLVGFAGFVACTTNNPAPPSPTVRGEITSSVPPTTVAPPPSSTPSLPPAGATPFIDKTGSPAPEDSVTASKNDGKNLILSNQKFYWTVTLPADWNVTYDTGFEVKANNPTQTAFLHLLSQTWGTSARLPDARAYVNYWKNFTYGNAFPLYADGSLISETPISANKFGGPYLRYEFDDATKGLNYLEVYASGGGPNSMVISVWSKRADFAQLQPTLDAILNSAELLKGQ